MKPMAMITGVWSKRSRRERLLLTTAVLLIAACMILAGVQGLARWRAAAAQRLASATTEHRAVVDGLARLEPKASRGTSERATSVEQAARQSAEAAGVKTTLETVAEGTRFTTEVVASVALFAWLSTLESDHNVRSVQLTAERTDEGLVVARGLLVPKEDGAA